MDQPLRIRYKTRGTGKQSAPGNIQKGADEAAREDAPLGDVKNNGPELLHNKPGRGESPAFPARHLA
jgi:hypothetical protein